MNDPRPPQLLRSLQSSSDAEARIHRSVLSVTGDKDTPPSSKGEGCKLLPRNERPSTVAPVVSQAYDLCGVSFVSQ